jgi:predicted nucleic acid-binding protein
MLVVADATPLNILIRIGQIDLIPQLFRHVLIPPAVMGELSHPNAPQIVRRWLLSAPAWLEVRKPQAPSMAPIEGEQEAIALAVEVSATLFLVDDRRARRDATERGLHVTGTLGILERAARQDLVDLHQAIDALRQTDFHIADAELEAALARHESARAATPVASAK